MNYSFVYQVSLIRQYLYSEVMPVHTMFRAHIHRHVHTVDIVVCHVIMIVTPLITPHVLVSCSVPWELKQHCINNWYTVTMLA